MGYEFPNPWRHIWEEWDLRILVVYSFIILLNLQLGGCIRRSTRRKSLHYLAWFFYLMADTWAAIALGKLSRVVAKDDRQMRHPWVPIVLLNHAGPDAITCLSLEENELWLRHFTAFLSHGSRAIYVIVATWTNNLAIVSVMCLLVLFVGAIKYGERIWVLRSRSSRVENSRGPILSQSLSATAERENNLGRFFPDADLLVKAFSCFDVLKPHAQKHTCRKENLEKMMGKLVNWFKEIYIAADPDELTAKTVGPFVQMIEMEMGFTYDMLFTKVGILFTWWGFVLRLFSFLGILCVLILISLSTQLLIDQHFDDKSAVFKTDLWITVALLVGITFVELCGICEQLLSDWAVFWAIKHTNSPKLVAAISRFQRFFNSPRSRRWSNDVGQFNFLEFCGNHQKATKLEKLLDGLHLRELFFEIRFSKHAQIMDNLRLLIIQQLHKRSAGVPFEGLIGLACSRGEWTLRNYEGLHELRWSIDIAFDESIIIWHIATEKILEAQKVFEASCGADTDLDEMDITKKLSHYMIYLLILCPSKFPICDFRENMYIQAHEGVVKFLQRGKEESAADSGADLPEKQEPFCNLERHVARLCGELKKREDRFKILKNMWLEMLCHAAYKCPWKSHAGQLNYGGELLTHVWLLLLHFDPRMSLPG